MTSKPGTTAIVGLAALVLLAAPRPGTAQGEGWGLSVGATMTHMTGDYVTTRGDDEWGFFAGAYGERVISSIIAVNLGVNYNQKGGQGLTGSIPDLRSFDIELNYVEAPLLVEILLPLGSTWGLIGYGGIAAGFNLKCEAAIDEADKMSCKDTELGGATLEWAVPAGGGLSYAVGDGDMVVFEARYSWGISDAVKEQNLRNEGWQFILRLARRL